MAYTVSIPRLTKLPASQETLEFKEIFPDLQTLTPVNAKVQVTHKGNYLEVIGQADGIITLTCDRCLTQYNHRLSIDTTELVWFNEGGGLTEMDELPIDKDLDLENMVETVSEDGDFDVSNWVYEQLALDFPYKKLCAADCSGIQIDEENKPPEGDLRWAGLEALKGQLPQ
ncbi:MAG: DUF177 domain-containing protein [Alkalinema sp. FL-bin-369]|nr:DUF177 domain-containing protein [Leptolyngbyaceae cyanobacterium LF-bin-369]